MSGHEKTHAAQRPFFVLLPLTAGTVLVLASAVCFFAWNWHHLSDTAKFSLAGGSASGCVLLALAAEHRQMTFLASLALLCAALFTGMFWAVFGQVFQSGATAREFCLAWAASITPLLLLRRSACLWNLWVLLLFAAAAGGPLSLSWDTWLSRPLPSLLIAAACSLAALVPPRFFRRPPGLNAWLLPPLTLLLAQATILSTASLLFQQQMLSTPVSFTGPAALAAVLTFALHWRYLPALYGLSLCGLIILNAFLVRLVFDDVFSSSPGVMLLFMLANIAYTVLTARALAFPSLRKQVAQWAVFPRITAGLGGLVSALSLSALTALFLDLDTMTAFAATGLVYMAAGTACWQIRKNSAFLLVLSPVLTATGAVFFHIALFDISNGTLLAGAWITAGLLHILPAGAALRFAAASWALLSTLFVLPLESDLPARALLFPVCLLPLAAGAFGRFPRGRMRPAAFACVAVLILISPLCEDLYAAISQDRHSLTGLLPATFYSLFLLLQLRQHLPPRHAPTFPSPAERITGMAMLILVCCFAPPECLLALLLISTGCTDTERNLTTGKKRPVLPLLTISGVLLLAVSLFCFYYRLSLPFSAKVTSMGIPGLCLLATGIWMAHRSGVIFQSSPGLTGCRPAGPRPRALPLALTIPLLAAFFCIAIEDRKTLLQEGEDMLLALAPVDPRAFMLGDYMELNYELELMLGSLPEGPGCLLLELDENRVARPAPHGILTGQNCDGEPAPALSMETAGGIPARLHLPRRYYFEEGLAPLYEQAAFAVLRCDGNDRCLLKGLADEKGRLLLPPERIE